MRLYLDQMIRTEVAELLREQGHDVLRAAEVGQSRADDQAILERACADSRVLVTLDEHFGDWAVLPLKQHTGVIRLKIHPTTVENFTAVLVPFLQGRTEGDLKDHLVIVSVKRERWIKTAT